MAERIDIIISEKGSRTVRRRLNEIGAGADRSARQVDVLRRALGLIGGGVIISQLGQLADTYTTIQNRIRVVTEGTGELAVVTEELFGIAQKSRSSFEATAEVYSRVALATQELGISQKETLNFSESLNQAVVLSGATAQEASAGLMQLSQGLASGTLRGDELRSVLEQLPVVADVIADSLDVTRGELRQLGADGKIAADTVLKAFKDAREELGERFGETVPTLAQSFQVLRNAVLKTVGSFSTGSGLSETFSRILIKLAEHVDTIARLAVAAGIALAINFAQTGVRAAVRGIAILTAAMATNPIGAIAVAITLAISALIAFSDQLQLTAGSIATAQDFLIVGFQQFVALVRQGIDFVIGFFTGFQSTLDDFDFLKFVSMIARGIDLMIGVFEGGFSAVRALVGDFPRVLGDLLISGINLLLRGLQALPGALLSLFERAFNAVKNAAVDFVNNLIETFNQVPGVGIGLIEKVKSVAADLADDGQITNVFQGAAANVGAAALEGFNRGFDRSLAQNAVVSIAEGAEGRAADRAARIAAEKKELEAARKQLTPPSTGGGTTTPSGTVGASQVAAFAEVAAALDRENALLALNTREREIAQAILAAEDKLKRELTQAEGQHVIQLTEVNSSLRAQNEVLNGLRGPKEELIEREKALNELYAQNRITLDEYNSSIIDIRNSQAELGEGSFVDAFQTSLERMTANIESFKTGAKGAFDSFFNHVSRGFSDTIGRAIFDTDNLGESLKAVARDAISSLVSSLIQLGIQFVTNQVLGEALSSTATATSAAQAKALTTQWAPAAAFASLASSGANALPAGAAITGTIALTKSLAAFRDGGFVSGPGGPRDDRVLAALSNGEFVMNARATSRNLPALQAMNSGREVRERRPVNVNYNISTPNADSFKRSQSQVLARTEGAMRRAEERNR